MRVIAGKYKRRNLKAVPGKNTRPTTDKNKENMFNLIGPYFEGGNVLDLFAGSGGLGIEALSRGMDHLYAIDQNYQAFQTVRDNLASLGIDEEANVYKMTCFKALEKFRDEKITFDLVLLDPPYGKGFVPKVIHLLLEYQLLAKDALLVAEEVNEVVLETNYGNLIKYKEVNYGLTTLHIYRMEESNYE